MTAHGRAKRSPQLRKYVATYMQRLEGMSPSTRSRYRSEITRYLVPRFGALPLDRISVTHVQKLLGDLMEAKTLAASSVSSVGRLLLRILATAALQGHRVQHIDARRMIAWPKEQRVRTEPRAFNSGEVSRILGASSGWVRVLFAVCAMSGLRAGEVLGLDWSDIDFPNQAMHIRRQASRGQLKRLKSVTSAATLPLNPELATILYRFWSDQGQQNKGLLFGGRGGLPRSAAGITTRHLTPLLARLEIPHGGLHAFRHGFCAECWRAGLPADVTRRLMRHSNLQMTLRYSHSAPAELKTGIERLAWHLPAETSPPKYEIANQSTPSEDVP